MQQKHFDYIIAYLNNQKKKSFTGSVKFGFERAKIVSIGESNSFDLPTQAIGKENAEEIIRNACGSDFNGTVVFVFDCGLLVEYGYARTYKGEDLHRLMGA